MARSIPMFAAFTAAICTAAVLSSAGLPSQGLAGEALQKALHDKAADFWIYDDLDAGYKAAQRTGKPLLVSFRCVP